MITIIGPRDPRISWAINVTSCSTDLGKQLSPMLLGPVTIPGRGIALKVENAWQYSKVYSHQVDRNGDPTAKWYLWSQKGYRSVRGERYPMGKGAIPLYSYWNNNQLDYLTARKEIYIPIYAKAARDSGWFGWLEGEYKEKGHLTLWDFDGYNRGSKTLLDCVEDTSRPLGHAFVLAMMLEGLI